MPKSADKGGIRTRLKMAFLGLSLGPLLLSGAVLAWQSSRIQLDQFLRQQHEITERALARIEDYFHNINDQLGMATEANNIMGLDSDRQKRILSGISSYRDGSHGHIYEMLMLLDKNGRVLARVARTRVYAGSDAMEMKGSEEFRQPMADGKVYYGPVVFDKTTGEPSMTIGMPMIGARTGRPGGVLVAVIRLKDIWGLVAGLQIGGGGSAFLLDGSGKVIAHKDHSLVLKGTYFPVRGEGIRKGLTDARAIIDTREIRLGNRRLFLVTERPLSEAMALTFRIVGIIGVFLLITLSGAVALGLLVRKQVIGPIESLADTVKAISGGDLSRRAEHSAADEIGVLVDSCNAMTRQLIETIDSLTAENAERRRAEAQLTEAAQKAEDEKARSDAIVAGIADGLSIQNAEFRILYQNEVHRNWFGDRVGEYCYTAYENRDAVCSECPLSLTLRDGSLHRAERAAVTAEGLRYLEVATSPLRDASGRMISVIEISRDITERKKAEEKTKASLHEKEMLLREIHHRVKNNMQVISSLLDIQSGYVEDRAVSEMFGKSRDRIRTMALIHEKLYGSEDMGRIDFAEYLKDLTDHVLNLYATDPGAVRLEMNVGEVRLDINTAVPVALIVHELLSNALLHAFPPGGEGKIRLELSPDDTGKFTLVVVDNGTGFPEGVDPAKPDSLGMQLVNTLVRQLKGRIEIDRTSGTAFTITFRQREPEKRRRETGA